MRARVSLLLASTLVLASVNIAASTLPTANAASKGIYFAVSKQLPIALTGKSYSYSFAKKVTGGNGPPYLWKLTGSLPAGLRFIPSKAKLSGNISKSARVATYSLKICVTGTKKITSSSTLMNTTCRTTKINVRRSATIATPTPTSSITSVPSVTSSSALTSPPSDMSGINDHADVFSTGLDPSAVTLGPKLGNKPQLPSYSGQTGLVAEVANGTPVLAPLDMRFVGFNNRNSDYRTASDGTQQVPFNDLELCFESTSLDWPGLIFCVYHLQNSPLLKGINLNPLCSNAVEWPGPLRAQGRQFYTDADYTLASTPISASCQALLGKSIQRGSVIGYAGRTGSHSQLPIRIKVRDMSVNPTVIKGDKYLHWVQPDVFFYWKCFGSSASFAPGVLAYPFECDGYQLPTAERAMNFKYQN